MTWNIFRYIWYFFKGNSTWWPPNLTLSEHWASRTQKIMTPLFSVYLEYQTNFEGISKTLALNWYTREASCFANHFALFRSMGRYFCFRSLFIKAKWFAKQLASLVYQCKAKVLHRISLKKVWHFKWDHTQNYSPRHNLT